MLNIIERLDPQQFRPAVCVRKKGGALDAVTESLGIPLLELPFSVPARPYSTLLFRAWKAARPFRQHRFDLWHSFNYSDDYTEPVVCRLAGGRGWIYLKKNMSWGSRAWHLRSLLATRIVAINRDMISQFFAAPRYARKIEVNPHGVLLDQFHPDIPHRLSLRTQLKLGPETTVIGTVGHILPIKGHATLFRAVAKLPQTVVLLAGKLMDESYAEELKQLIQQLGIERRVHFLGSVEDVPAFLAELDVFTFTTTATGEGLGCALTEAMAAAKACVATDVSGLRDQIEHDRSGLLVPPEDPEALAAAVGALVNAPEKRAALGKMARARVEEHFSIDREVATYERIYREIVRRPRAV